MPRRPHPQDGTRANGVRSLEREVVVFVFVGLLLIVVSVFSGLAPHLGASEASKEGTSQKPGARKKDLDQVRESFRSGTYAKKEAYFVRDPARATSRAPGEGMAVGGGGS